MPYKDKAKQKQAQHESYLKNKEGILSRNQLRRLKRKQWLSDFLDDKSCTLCGEDDNVCLDFHHIDPSIKVDGVPRMNNEFRTRKAVLEEIAKCIIICSNCHRRLHNGV